MAEVTYSDGTSSMQLFTHQDHVVNAGEMEVIGSARHCEIAVCKHPNRPIRTVQFHPEAVKSLLDYSVECGDLTQEERSAFGYEEQDLNVTDSLIRPKF